MAATTPAMAASEHAEVAAVRFACERGLLSPADVQAAVREREARGAPRGALLPHLEARLGVGARTHLREAYERALAAATAADASARAAGPTSGPSAGGRYQLLSELGRGGMGAVWRARDALLGREVALKTFALPHEAAPEDLERFRIEARATARLCHPNLVPVLDCDLEGPVPFLVLELVEGESLAARLAREGPLAHAEAARLVAQVARATAAAHAEGILHRDLKPENVLLDRDGQPRLTDFGLARDLGLRGGLTATGEVLGTPAFMAPEQALGDPAALGPAVDVYGLGALLYALLTGRPPFSGANAINVLAAVMSDEPLAPSRLRPDLDPGLEALCLRCLVKTPGERWGSAAALADALEAWRPGGPGARRSRAPGRLAAGALAGLAVAAGGLAAWSGGGEPSAAPSPPPSAASSPATSPTTNPAPPGPTASPPSPLAEARRHRRRGRARQALELLLRLPETAEVLVERAQACFELARWDEGLECARRALELDPEHAPAWGARGSLWLEKGEQDRGLADLRRAADLDADLAWVWAALARVSALIGDEAAARRALDHLLRLAPGDAGTFQVAAEALKLLGRLEEAEEVLSRGLALLPSDPRLRYLRGLARRDREDHAGAVEDLERALAAVAASGATPEHVALRVWCADARRRRGDLDAAQAHCAAALALSPEDGRALAIRALVRLDAGRPGDATADAQRAVEVAPDVDLTWASLGEVLRDQGRLADALRAAQRALDLDRLDPARWIALGRLRAQAGQTARAVWELSEGVSGARGGAPLVRALVARAECLFGAGDAASARRDLTRARAALDQVQAPAQLARAVADLARRVEEAARAGGGASFGRADPRWREVERRLEAGDARGAGEVVEHLLDVAGGLGRTWRYRGEVRLKLGDPRAALPDLDRAVALAPGDARAWKWRAAAFHMVDRLEEALASNVCAVTLAPEEPDHWAQRALFLAQADRAEAALVQARRAISLQPGLAESHATCGLVLLRLERWAEALEQYERARVGSPDWGRPRLGCGIARLRLGDSAAEALADLRAGLELGEGSSVWLREVLSAVESLRSSGNLPEARRAEADYVTALALEGLGERQRAVASLDAAIRADPGLAAAWLRRALLWLDSSGLELLAVARDLATAVELDPGLGGTHAREAVAARLPAPASVLLARVRQLEERPRDAREARHLAQLRRLLEELATGE